MKPVMRGISAVRGPRYPSRHQAALLTTLTVPFPLANERNYLTGLRLSFTLLTVTVALLLKARLPSPPADETIVSNIAHLAATTEDVQLLSSAIWGEVHRMDVVISPSPSSGHRSSLDGRQEVFTIPRDVPYTVALIPSFSPVSNVTATTSDSDLSTAASLTLGIILFILSLLVLIIFTLIWGETNEDLIIGRAFAGRMK
jgi:hypothetical protein